MRPDRMELDARAFGLAASSVAAALFTMCALAVAIAPVPTTAFVGSLIHLDLSGVARTITWAMYLSGLICWSVGAGLVFAAVGTLYNRFTRWRPEAVRADVAAGRLA